MLISRVLYKLLEKQYQRKNIPEKDFEGIIFVCSILGAIIGAIMFTGAGAFAAAGAIIVAFAAAIIVAFAGAIIVAFAAAGAIIVAFAAAGAIVPNLSNETFAFWMIILGLSWLIGEIVFFLFDNRKPGKNDSIFWFTASRKLLAIYESFLILMNLNFLRYIDWQKAFPELVKWCGYIGITLLGITLVAGVFIGWIKLNALKYAERRSPKTELTRAPKLSKKKRA